jgi:hypothetical protein
MKKTSLTHPIKIAAISAGPLLGRVGITFCPGKFDPQAMGGSCDRDLSLNLDAIQVWGAAAVVALISKPLSDQQAKAIWRLPDQPDTRGHAGQHGPSGLGFNHCGRFLHESYRRAGDVSVPHPSAALDRINHMSGIRAAQHGGIV